MSLPKVTVITRTKDRRDLLPDAIRSVAEQTWPHVQYVVVNDGGASVDDLLDPYRSRLEVTYLEPGTVGRCRAGNLGLAAATGEWIAWLDDDDYYLPEHLETLVTRAREQDRKVVYGDAWQVAQERDGPDAPWREVSRTVPFSEEFSRVMLLRRSYIHLVTFLHHREAYELLGGFDESLEVLEDLDLFFRYAQDYDFLHVAKPTACFRIRNDRSNAVTALRGEFVTTRALLFGRYAHIALPEMLDTLDYGEQILSEAMRRVEELSAALEEERARGDRLEARLSRLEGP